MASVAQADRLILESGDVLTGEYIGREDGRILFRSVLMGEIRVDAERGRVEREPAGEILPAGAWVEWVAEEEEAEEPVVEEEAAGASGEGESVPGLESEGGWWAQWEQRIRVGYSWESAESRTDDLSIRYEAGREWAGGSLRLQGRYEYGSSKDGDAEKVVVRDRWAGSLRYRSDFGGERWFLQLDGNYKRDELQEIAHEVRQNSGVGWRAVNREKWQITLLPQLTVRYLELMREQPGWDLLFSLRQDLRFRWSERVEFRQAAGISWDPDDFRRSNYELEFRMENRLTERLFLDLAYELEFDYELDFGVNSKTQRTILLLGYEF